MALGWKLLGANMDGLQVAASNDALTGISAAGSSQSDATELANGINFVSTVSSGQGVVLSSKLAAGDSQVVYNGGLNPLKVYPTSGMKINNLVTNSSMTLARNTGIEFHCVSTTQIVAVLSA